MSQGSSRAPVVVRPPSRFPLGPSGIPLICCPSCGKGVEEYKSKKQGGRIFFKCPDNEQYDPNSCSFFKWIDSYLKMIEGMDLYTPEDGVVGDDFATPIAHVVPAHLDADGDKEVTGKMATGGKMDVMQMLVLINLGQLVVMFVALCVMFLK
uniref:GRF-type domain-containing protein n=1 Tax=Oryza rufipogon TaxID=4529 RepID=A0A0E0PIC2_ORYRU